MKNSLMKTGKKLLNQQLNAYGLGEISDSLNNQFSLSGDGLNRYLLAVDGLGAQLSVLNVQGYEHLSEPWRYEIQFTAQCGLSMEQVLSEKAAFTLAPGGISGQKDSVAPLSHELMSAFNAFGGMFSDKLDSAGNLALNQANQAANRLGKAANTIGGMTDKVSHVFGSSGSRLSSLSSIASSLGVGESEVRILYGVVTAFSQLACSADEARYAITLSPRLAQLDNTQNSAIFQNQTVPQVVEQVLRQHDMSGVDFRFELTEIYPVKEYITQWQESDLAFIRRLLADSGIWFSFETHAKHSCDVVVFGDSEQQYQDGPTASYCQPSGNNDNGVQSVWDMSVVRKTVPQSVLTQDYNYRNAQTGMKSEVNGAQKDKTTRGQHYVYAEHYRDKGEVVNNPNAQDELSGQFSNMMPNGLSGTPDVSGSLHGFITENTEQFSALNHNGNEQIADEEPDTVGQGSWYARLRHQRFMTEQITISGKTTLSHLAPGQILTVSGSPVAEASSGILIVSVETQGDRQQAYVITFTAIPYDVLRPYRPADLIWPTISGTLPARVSSPNNDTYSYMDVQGRYRVKMDFDLNDNWRKGEESLWMRLAKPYAGETYGIHFPLIDGTEVAIAFSGGNPDRPYIAHAMHDSRHTDLVTLANHKRNIIRTPANNKLRMDDERSKEHIKLATEYGKTQLNMGHLVDSERKLRGEGFELRTDEWGAIRSGRGLFISADKQGQVQGRQLDMNEAVEQLENALSIARALSKAAETAQAYGADMVSQEQLNQALINLNLPGMVLNAPEGIGISSPKALRISSGSASVGITAGQNADIGVLKKFTVVAGEAVSMLAQKMGMKLFAAKGKVEIQAQSDSIEMVAQNDVNITTVDGVVMVTAAKELVLNCNGAYIKLSGGNIEIGCPNNILLKCANGQKMGPENYNSPKPELPRGFSESFIIKDQTTGEAIPFTKYRITAKDGTIYEGVSDEYGNTMPIYTAAPTSLTIDFYDEKSEPEPEPEPESKARLYW